MDEQRNRLKIISTFLILFLIIMLITSQQAISKTYGKYIISNVPYIRQKPHWCGPAALAMVLNYWGLNISQDEIAAEIYRPDKKLTYISDMVKYPQSLGFYSKAFTGSIDILKSYIIADIPVIVLQKFSTIIPTGHYRVVIGFDDHEQLLYVLDPTVGEYAIPYNEFVELWKPGSTFKVTNWSLIIYPKSFIASTITKTLIRTETYTLPLTKTKYINVTTTVTTKVSEFTPLGYTSIIFIVLIGLLIYLYLVRLRRARYS